MTSNIGGNDPKFTTLSDEERVKYLKKNKKQISMDTDGNIWYEAKSTTNVTGLKDLFNISDKMLYANNPNMKNKDSLSIYQKYKVDHVDNLEEGSEAKVLADFKNKHSANLKRKGWFDRNAKNIFTDGKSVYYTPDKKTTLGNIGLLFDIENTQEILKNNNIDSIEEGVTIKVENVDELDDLEVNKLQMKIDYAKKRAGWFEKNGKNIHISDGKVFYTPQEGTTLGNIGLLFDLNDNEKNAIISNPNNQMDSATDLKVGKPIQICLEKDLDPLEKQVIVNKNMTLDNPTDTIGEFTTSRWDDIKANLKATPGLELSDKGAEYIKGREAAKLNSKGYVVYQGAADKKGTLTVAHGHAQGGNKIKVNGKLYKEGQVITLAEGEMLFAKDTKEAIKTLYKKVKKGAKLTPNQKDAALSYTFNTGGAKLIKSKKKETFADLLSKGKFDEAQGRFNIIDANGKPTLGVAKRRIEELGIFSDGNLSAEGLELLENRLMGSDYHRKFTKSDINDIMIRLNKYGISNAEGFKKTLDALLLKQ